MTDRASGEAGAASPQRRDIEQHQRCGFPHPSYEGIRCTRTPEHVGKHFSPGPTSHAVTEWIGGAASPAPASPTDDLAHRVIVLADSHGVRLSGKATRWFAARLLDGSFADVLRVSPPAEAAPSAAPSLDSIYRERNAVVFAYAQLARALGWNVGTLPGEGDVEWRIVYVDTPEGQVSWHYHADNEPWFKALPGYLGRWDGHSTETKHVRLFRAALRLSPEPSSALNRDAYVMAMALLQSPQYQQADDELRAAIDDTLARATPDVILGRSEGAGSSLPATPPESQVWEVARVMSLHLPGVGVSYEAAEAVLAAVRSLPSGEPQEQKRPSEDCTLCQEQRPHRHFSDDDGVMHTVLV